MKKIAFLFMLTVSVSLVYAQTAEDSVKAAVNKLFSAMRSSDAVMLQSVFADSAILQTIDSRGGKTVVKTNSVTGFAESISKIPPGAADERINFGAVNIDADLASVWTPYQFYFNGKFSHCGVNSFQLVRFNNEWKIKYLIDTRRRDNCD